MRYKLSALIRHQDNREQRIGRLDEICHLFRLFVGMHVLLRIVGEAGIARRVPVIELDALRTFQVFTRDGEREAKNFQRMGDVLLGDVVHGRSLPKRERPVK